MIFSNKNFLITFLTNSQTLSNIQIILKKKFIFKRYLKIRLSIPKKISLISIWKGLPNRLVKIYFSQDLMLSSTIKMIKSSKHSTNPLNKNTQVHFLNYRSK